MESLAQYLSSITLSLDHIYLDPNNPRFVGSNWSYVPDAEAIEEPAQQRARQRLIDDFDVRKLQANIEINGYLPVDRIIVRRVNDSAFIVLEGNRRICSAKMINKFTDSGEQVSDDVLATLGNIPALEYTGSNAANEASWIFQGLRHISGVADWSAFNKAKLLVDQMERDQLSLTDVGRRFGLTSFGAGQWVRGYHAFKQAREDTEYGEVIDELIYPYLQEVFGRSSIAVREWMAWDDTTYQFKDIASLNEFIGWFYPTDSESEDEATQVDKEAWSRRFIGKRDDIRQIAFLIQNSPTEWLAFRQDGDVESAYSRAMLAKYEKENTEQVDFTKKLFEEIHKCTSMILNAPISVLRDEEKKVRLDDLISKLISAIDLLK